MNSRKLIIAVLLLAGVATFFALDLDRYLGPGLRTWGHPHLPDEVRGQ